MPHMDLHCRRICQSLACLIVVGVTGGSYNPAQAAGSRQSGVVENHSDKVVASQREQRSWKGKLVIPEPNTVYDTSSEYKREGKRFFTHVGGGVILGEVALGVFLNPDSLFDIRYLRQHDVIAGRSSTLLASYSHFVDNSLFLRAGFGYRVGTVIDYLDSFAGNRGERTSSSYALDFGIGNRWQWDYLSIGGEWFGLTIPVTGKTEESFDFQFRIMTMHIGVSF